MTRAWRAELTREPWGLARPAGAPPCEPAVWAEVTVEGDGTDAIIADDGRSMWRVEQADGTRRAYACVAGEAVMLPELYPFESDPLSAWEDAEDATAMLESARLVIDESAARLAALACVRAVLHLVPAGEDRPRLALDAIERAVRDPSPQTRKAATDAAERSLAVATGLAGDGRTRAAALHAHVAGLAYVAATEPVDAAWHAVQMRRELSIDFTAVMRGVIPTEAVYAALTRRVSS